MDILIIEVLLRSNNGNLFWIVITDTSCILSKFVGWDTMHSIWHWKLWAWILLGGVWTPSSSDMSSIILSRVNHSLQLCDQNIWDYHERRTPSVVNHRKREEILSTLVTNNLQPIWWTFSASLQDQIYSQSSTVIVANQQPFRHRRTSPS